MIGLFATTPTYAGVLAARSFLATDRLRVTSGLNDSGGIINIDVMFTRTPSILQ